MQLRYVQRRGLAHTEIGLTREEEHEMRIGVAEYCLAHLGKPYNLNFLDPDREDAFYCSQLAYKAYRSCGINLNTGMFMEQLPGTNQIIYPQEIWDFCPHRREENSPAAVGSIDLASPPRRIFRRSQGVGNWRNNENQCGHHISLRVRQREVS